MFCLRFKKVWSYWIVGICIALFGRYLQMNDFSLLNDPYLPWFYKSGIVAVAFLVTGGVYSQYEARIDGRFNGFSKLLLTLILIVSYVSLYSYYSNSIKFSVIFGMDLGGYFISLLSIFALIYLCKFLKAVSFVRYVSRHSIGYYFLSASIPYASCFFVEKLVPMGSIGYILEFAVSFIGAILSVYLINRFLPWMFDLRLLR